MSKKSFFIIFGLSVIIWIISAIAQGILDTLYNFNPLSGSCQVTGYPIASCINSLEGLPVGYYFLNITLWFIILFIGWRVIQRVVKK